MYNATLARMLLFLNKKIITTLTSTADWSPKIYLPILLSSSIHWYQSAETEMNQMFLALSGLEIAEETSNPFDSYKPTNNFNS